MVKNVRFHDVMLSLYWDDELVGKIQIAVTRPLSLVGGAGNVTQDLANQLAQPKSGTSSGNTTLIEPVFGNKTDSDLESFNSSAFNDYNAQRATVIFESIAGGGVVNRNDVFLTFYTALIHVAHFSIEDQMQTFQSDPPSRKACLHMQDMRTVCQVSWTRCRYGLCSPLLHKDQTINVCRLTLCSNTVWRCHLRLALCAQVYDGA